MSDPIMYEEENFVVLQTNQPDQFLTALELTQKLKEVLQELSEDQLPQDLKKINSLDAQAKYLIDTSCELDLEPGKYLKWYAIRLEK